MKQSVNTSTGIITPMVTPMTTYHSIDKDGLKRLVDHLVAGGVHGIFVLGTTGEATSLSAGLKRELISLTCDFVNKRVPVLTGITDPSPQDSIDLAKFAAESGVSSVVAAPPYYFTLNQEELLTYYTALADQLPLPLYLYNMPVQTKVMIEPGTVKQLSRHENIIGIKDSSGSAPYFNTLLYTLKDNPGFSVFVGPDEMMAQSVLLGGSGGVNSGSNMYPEIFVQLYNAAREGNLGLVSSLQQIVMEISSQVYSQGSASYRYLQGIKVVLSQMGICENNITGPLQPVATAHIDAIRESMSLVHEMKKNLPA